MDIFVVLNYYVVKYIVYIYFFVYNLLTNTVFAELCN
jgi:hypothetical protein